MKTRRAVVALAFALLIGIALGFHSPAESQSGRWDSETNRYHDTTWWDGKFVYMIDSTTGDTLSISPLRITITDGTSISWMSKDSSSTTTVLADTLIHGTIYLTDKVSTDSLGADSDPQITVVSDADFTKGLKISAGDTLYIVSGADTAYFYNDGTNLILYSDTPFKSTSDWIFSAYEKMDGDSLQVQTWLRIMCDTEFDAATHDIGDATNPVDSLFVGTLWGADDAVVIAAGDSLIGLDATGADRWSISDDGDTTRIHSDNPFEMNRSLTLPGGSLIIGGFSISEDHTDNDGVELAGTWHAHANAGVAGSICLHEGTAPTVSGSGDGHRLWADSSHVFWHQDESGTNHKVIEDDGSGLVVIDAIVRLGADGNAASPGYSWVDDPNTGLYRIGDGSLGFSANNSLNMRISATEVALYQNLKFSGAGLVLFSSADLKFGSGNSTGVKMTLKSNGTFDVVDSLTAGTIGIGTSSASSIFHIKASTSGTVGSHPAGQIIIQSPGVDSTANVVITAYESDGSGDPELQLWYLGNPSSGNADVTFFNRRDAKLTLGTNGVTRLTISGSGDVDVIEDLTAGTVVSDAGVSGTVLTASTSLDLATNSANLLLEEEDIPGVANQAWVNGDTLFYNDGGGVHYWLKTGDR